METPDDYKSEYTYINPPPMIKTWISALTKPTVENYRRLAENKHATIAIASQWYLIALVVSSLINFVLGLIITRIRIDDWSNVGYGIVLARENVFYAGGMVLIFAGMYTCAIPIGIFITTMVLMFDNWLADKIGGEGSFDAFVYVCISWMSPLAILSSIIYQIPQTYTFILGLNALLHTYLMGNTLRAIKRLPVVKSIFVALIPVIGAVIIAALYNGILSSAG